MNADGYLVPIGQELLDVDPNSEESPIPAADNFKHEDLTTLLRKINNIYDNQIQPQERFEDYVPTMNNSTPSSATDARSNGEIELVFFSLWSTR